MGDPSLFFETMQAQVRCRLRAFQTERAISAMSIPVAAAAGLMCMANSPFCFDLVPVVADTGCAVADSGCDGIRELF